MCAHETVILAVYMHRNTTTTAVAAADVSFCLPGLVFTEVSK